MKIFIDLLNMFEGKVPSMLLDAEYKSVLELEL